MKKKSISIVIPAYNEEETIEEVLRSLLRLRLEIIVVNDGSRDRTASILASYPDVRVITHKKRLGYGAALKKGIENCKTDYVLIIDADGTYPAHYAGKLLNGIDYDDDMVVGKRCFHKDFSFKGIAGSVWRGFFSLFGSPDINSGFRVFRTDIVRKYISLFPDGYSFTTTLTTLFMRAGLKTRYVNIPYMQRGASKLSVSRNIFHIPMAVLRFIILFERRRHRK